MNDHIEATSNVLDVFNGHTLQFFQHIQVQFGLTPRQYPRWVAKFVRRGKCMVRKCSSVTGSLPQWIQGKDIARIVRARDDLTLLRIRVSTRNILDN